jgi:hypothetical protein
MIDDDSTAADGSEPPEPAKPRRPYSERPVARARRAKAKELIDRLVAEGRVRITDPDDDEVAEWRRVVNYAKRHGLEPAGGGLVPVPVGLVHLHPVVAALGGDESWLVMPHALRRRSLLLLRRVWRLSRYGAGTRCGRPGRPSSRVRAEWTSLVGRALRTRRKRRDLLEVVDRWL